MNRVEPRSDNAPRFPDSNRGHVESWFVRANDPDAPRAIWLKATVLRKADGSAVAEAWCALFDGDHTSASKVSIPLADATFGGGRDARRHEEASRSGGRPAHRPDETAITIGDCGFVVGADGSAKGKIGDVSWDLRWLADSRIGGPMIPYPTRRMVDSAFPKSKLLTPVPAARFTGSFTWTGRKIAVDGWTGMQGHNWGREHAHEYAWGQCVFPGAGGEPHAMVEGFSGRVRIAGRATPLISALVVRRGDQTFRFDRLIDLWNQKVTVRDLQWTARLRGPDGDALLSMEADPRRTVCLGYENPDGAMSYCLNSKLARTFLRVNPVNGPGFELRSPHGGALEFLRRTPDPRFPDLV